MSRIERVAEFLKKEISDILKFKVNDPRIGFVTITDVEVGSDLKHAKVFISILGDEKSKISSMQGLVSAAPFVRSELGKVLEMRETPEIRFERDDSLERGSKILTLMKKIHEERKKKVRRRA